MTTDRERILRKIRSCLRLSASPNPNEAAAALRQARALMIAHGLTEADALAIDVRFADATTRQRGATPPPSLVRLATFVARLFRCEPLLRVGGATTTVRFFGIDADAEVAAYAFAVLRRQIEADKAHHTRRVRKRVVKEQRAEAFAQGWVRALAAQSPTDDLDAPRASKIATAMRALHGQLDTTQGRGIAANRRTAESDAFAGWQAGKRAKVNPGINGVAPRLLEGAGA